MTTEAYPKLRKEDIKEITLILREVIRLRDLDVTMFINLDNKFLPGRSTNRIPSSPTDTNKDDNPGDIVNDGTFEYKLIDDAGDFKWDRRTLDFSW